MSIEGFNKRKTRNSKTTTLSKFMTAAEARNELDVVVANLAVNELVKAIAKVKESVANGKNTTAFAFSYNSSAEVIAATISMLRDLEYEVVPSKYYNDVINITVK